VPGKLAISILLNGIYNLIFKKPLAVSFEITHSCNANCSHCDKEGIIPNENIAPPEKFDEVYQQLRPLFAQLSGGEPLLREDYLEIVKLFRSHGTMPLIAFVSNASLMTPEKYKELVEHGVNQFSISLDMPDERHDANRRIPGLYKHLSELIPKMTSMGYHNVTMISAIRKANLPYLVDIANKAFEWNASMIFSSYTKLRTNSDEHSLQTEEELQLLRDQIEQLIEMKKKGAAIYNTENMFRNMIKFFETNYIPNCQTGIRHLVVNPDASLVPCAMHKVNFQKQEDLVRDFTRQNECGACYVPLRATSEFTLRDYIRDFAVEYIKNRFR
jgi:MoaA/NifB/PqqE/SkfB family radical SAM enzyme